MVYGGYGLGKTTFSLYLASKLSEKYLSGEFDRIPIRIALGGMYSKQDLIALICSALSGGESGVAVKDFSYALFLEMSRQGRYLLILDGFDEMRHAMDLDDFVYTFEQMKPLLSGQAKVVILGRPDSFLTTQEEEQVLSSLFDSGSEQNTRMTKVEVAFFTKSEIHGYLDYFLSLRSEGLSPKQQENFSTLLSRLPDSEDNLLSRPVQLRMFTKIIDECLSSDTLLNRYELYKRFIYNFLARESQKAARQPSGIVSGLKDLKDDRAKFMQAMAWWILNGKKENRFLPEEIPVDIIPAKIRSGLATSAAI
jgi:predicted NACHT family NTPase